MVGSNLVAGRLRGYEAVPSLTGRSSLVEESLAAERLACCAFKVALYKPTV